MDGSNEAQIVTRVVLEGSVFLVKVAGKAAGRMLTFLAAASEGSEKMKGKINLLALLKSGKELKCFTFKEDQIKIFAEEAKRYGIVYSMVKRGPADKEAGTYDVLCKAEDAARLNRILERMGVGEVQVTAQGNEATEEEKNSKEISDVRNLLTQMMQPDENTLNPEMAADAGRLTQSAASYQRMPDIPVESRTSVKEEINNINSNIENYQPKEEAGQGQLAELLKNMLSSSGKDDAVNDFSAAEPERMQTASAEKYNENSGLNDKADFSDNVKADSGGRTNTVPGTLKPSKPFMEDEKDRLMKELENSYSRLIDGLNAKESGRE